jgi:hypothetical protein
MISAVPNQGGWTWVILQYLLGLKQLGHDVYFVEVLPRKALIPDGTNDSRFPRMQHIFDRLSLSSIWSATLRSSCRKQRESVGLS